MSAQQKALSTIRSLPKNMVFHTAPSLVNCSYAYVTCRPNIGYAVVTLSKFASAPHSSHYTLLRKVAKYLRQTRDTP